MTWLISFRTRACLDAMDCNALNYSTLLGKQNGWMRTVCPALLWPPLYFREALQIYQSERCMRKDLNKGQQGLCMGVVILEKEVGLLGGMVMYSSMDDV